MWEKDGLSGQYFLPRMRYFPEKQGKGQQRGINPNLYYDIILFMGLHGLTPRFCIFMYIRSNKTTTTHKNEQVIFVVTNRNIEEICVSVLLDDAVSHQANLINYKT